MFEKDNATTVLYFLLVACTLQTFANYLEFQRTQLLLKLFLGVSAFASLTIGISAFIIYINVSFVEPLRPWVFYTMYYGIICGCIFWVFDQIFWIARKTRIDFTIDEKEQRDHAAALKCTKLSKHHHQ